MTAAAMAHMARRVTKRNGSAPANRTATMRIGTPKRAMAIPMTGSMLTLDSCGV